MALEESVAAFLFFGYLPRLDLGFQRELVVPATTAEPASDQRQLLARGAAALGAAFEHPGPGPHVVPLSGGLDSRAVLAGLIAAGAAEQVVAVTVGTPGMLDFDLGRRVAAAAGVAHEQIDLRTVSIEAEALEAALAATGATSWAFDLFFHRLIPQRFGAGATYWSGFLGEALAGAHLPARPAETWAAALDHFAGRNRFCNVPALHRPGFSPHDVLPAQPALDPAVLSYTDQLDIGIRQASYIRGTVLVEGRDYRTPFLHPHWVRFTLALPHELRVGQRFYRDLLAATYPTLFTLPTKNTVGLPPRAPQWVVAARVRWWKARDALSTGSTREVLRGRDLPTPFPLLNYLDFASAIDRRPDVRQLVHDTVCALDERGVAPWVDGADLLRRHHQNPRDVELACALTLLCSLELNLRADERRPTKRFSLDH